MSDMTLPGFMNPADADALARINADRIRRGWAPLGQNSGSVRPFTPPVSGVPVASPFNGGRSVQPLGAPIPSIPPPQYPDLSAQIADTEALRRQQAALGLNQFTNEQAQVNSQLADLQARGAAQPKFDPTAAAYHWNPVQPQSLGSPQFVPVATRPAPGHDTLSAGLAALAGLFDPRGAGRYSAAPLEAGVQVANQQYQDKLQQNAIQQQQYLQQYEAQKADAEQQNRYALLNAEQQRAADVLSLGDQQRLGTQNAQITGQIAGAQNLAGAIPGLSALATKSAGLGADLTNAEQEIAAGQNRYKSELEAWKEQYGAAAKYYQNLSTVQGRQGVADTNAGARVQSAQIGADSRETVGQGHDEARLKGIGLQQAGATQRTGMNNATSTANNIRNNAPLTDAPTGAAAKDPGVTNAFRSLLQIQGDHAKTERLLLQAYRAAGGDVNNNAAFSQWMHANPLWQRSSQAVQSANGAYQVELARAGAKQTPTPGGVSNGSNNKSGTPAGQAAPGFDQILHNANPTLPGGNRTFRYDKNGNRIP